ncbi:hypothetical protein RYX36_034702 [Vicia faba]
MRVSFSFISFLIEIPIMEEDLRLRRDFHSPSFSELNRSEVADQNFKDEVASSSSSVPMAKRLKTVAANGSITDQIVPFEKFQTTDVSTISNATPENEGHELIFHLPQR